MLIDLPRYPPAPAEVTSRLRQPSQANRSEFTGARRVTILAEAPRWTFKVRYPAIIGEAAFRPWRATLALLQGRAGMFRLPVTEGIQRASYGAVGAAAVDGAGQVGTTIRLRGFFPGSGLLFGWFVTIGGRPYQVVAPAMAGSDGRLTVKVMPQVAGYPDGTVVEAIRPYATVSLSDDEAGWTVGPGQRYELAFDCEEAS